MSSKFHFNKPTVSFSKISINNPKDSSQLYDSEQPVYGPHPLEEELPVYGPQLPDFDISNSIIYPNYNHKYIYSNTQHSDKENIYISKLRIFTEQLQENYAKNPQYYKIICDVISKNDVILVDLSSEETIVNLLREEELSENEIEEIKEIYMKTMNKLDFSDFGNLGSYYVEEIVSQDSGYDAVVLRNPENGNYIIENCCTNDGSLKDISFIAYTVSKDITGDGALLSTLGRFFNLIPDSMAEGLDHLDEKSCKKIYENQINDSIELIKKYSNTIDEEGKGAKLELYGYSLGGGNMATSIASLLLNEEENKKILGNINNVTLYNPLILVAEEYDEEAIDKLANYDKLLIYSAQQDFVTEFNDSIDKLNRNGKVVYLKSENLKFNNVMDLFAAIIGSSGNHGFSKLEKYDNFDENGNLKGNAGRSSLEYVAWKINSDLKTKNRQEAFSTIMNTLIIKAIPDDYKDSISVTLFSFLSQICDNWGNTDMKNNIADSIVELAWPIICDEAKKSIPSNFWDQKPEETIANKILKTKKRDEFLGKTVFSSLVHKLLNDENTYEMISYIIEGYILYDSKNPNESYKTLYYVYCQTLLDYINEWYDYYIDNESLYNSAYGSWDKKATTKVKNNIHKKMENLMKDLYFGKFYTDDMIINELTDEEWNQITINSLRQNESYNSFFSMLKFSQTNPESYERNLNILDTFINTEKPKLQEKYVKEQKEEIWKNNENSMIYKSLIDEVTKTLPKPIELPKAEVQYGEDGNVITAGLAPGTPYINATTTTTAAAAPNIDD